MQGEKMMADITGEQVQEDRGWWMEMYAWKEEVAHLKYEQALWWSCNFLIIFLCNVSLQDLHNQLKRYNNILCIHVQVQIISMPFT